MQRIYLQATGKAQRKALALSIFSALALAACGEGGSEKTASQVAAKVNGQEISIHQVNFVLQRTPGVPPEKAEELKREILNGLVDQELAIQQALEAKLDRDPRIMQTLEAARREILAQAYIERAVAERSKPSAEEVRAYYREHPELFSNRRIYRLQEIGFTAPPQTIAQLREQLTRTKGGDELVAALKARGIKLTGGVSTRPAEKIPLDILPRLMEMKAGQSALFDSGDKASIITVLDSTAQPLTEEAARPIIEQFLGRRQASDLARETLQQLRAKASIEYVGEFGKAAEEARLAHQAEAARQDKEAREAREAARLAQAAQAERQAAEARKARETAAAERERQAPGLTPPSDGTLQRGLSGLK